MDNKLKIPRLKSGDGIAFFLLALLGMICILNLNAMTSKYLGLEQFFSPLVLLLCVVGILASGKNPFEKLGFYGWWWVVGYLVYMSIGAVSGYKNGNFYAVPSELFNFSAAVGVAVATVLLSQRMIRGGQVDRMFRFVYWLGLASVGTFYVSYFFGFNAATAEASFRSGRISGFFGNPNELGLQTQITTVFGFCLAARTLSIKYLVITLLVCGPAVLGTNSRSSLLAVASIVGILSFFVFPPKYVFRTTISLALVGILGFFSVNYLKSLSYGGGTHYQKNRTNQLFDFLSGRVSAETTGHRYDLALEAIELFQDKPIVGWGLGFSNQLPHHGLAPHNAILKLLVDSGVLGTATLALFWVVFFVNMLKAHPRWLKVGLLGMFLAVSFSLMSGHTGISRRYSVFQLAIVIATLEPFSQRIIANGNQSKARFITWIKPGQARQQMPPGRFLHQ